jgi:hypothetical protein
MSGKRDFVIDVRITQIVPGHCCDSMGETTTKGVDEAFCGG